jgi:hypothetical protein
LKSGLRFWYTEGMGFLNKGVAETGYLSDAKA